MIVVTVFSISKQFIFARLLGVEGYAFYSLVFLFQSFGIYFVSIGLIEGLTRELTIFNNSHRLVRRKLVNSLILSSLLLLCTMVGLFLFFFLLLNSTRIEVWVYLIVPFSFATIIFNASLVKFLTEQNIIAYAKFNLMKVSLVLLICSFIAAITRDYYPVVVAEILILTFSSFILLKLSGFVFRLPKKKLIIRYISKGWYFNVLNFVRSITFTLDRVIISSGFSKVVFGYYSFAMLVFSVGLIMTTIIGTALKPRIIQYYTLTGSERKTFFYTLKISISIVFFLGFSIYPVNEFVGFIISRFFEEYLTSKSLVVYFIIAAVFLTGNIFDFCLLAIGKGKMAVIISMIVILLYILILGCLKYQESSLDSFAKSFLLIQVVNYIVGLLLCCRYCVFNRSEIG